MFDALIIDRMWNNLDFWHILFLTVVISLLIVKLSAFIDKKAGVFQKYKQHDLIIYKKLSGFLSDDDIANFLNELKEKLRYKKSILQQVVDFESLITSSTNIYKSDILKSHIDMLLKNINNLKHFLVVNFSEEDPTQTFSDEYLTLLPETRTSISNDKKKEIYAQDAQMKDNALQIIEEKREFYLQKERELKELIQKTEDEYLAYRAIIKRYLNV